MAPANEITFDFAIMPSFLCLRFDDEASEAEAMGTVLFAEKNHYKNHELGL